MKKIAQQYSKDKFEMWQGGYFHIQKPKHWKAISSPEFQAVFIGQKIKSVRINITVQTTDDDTTRTLSDFAKNLRFIQSEKHEKYILISTNQRITYPFPNLLQLCRWYNAYSDNVIYQRQFLVRTGKHFHLITTTQPAHKEFDIIDDLFDNIICSFLPYESAPKQALADKLVEQTS